MQIWTSDGIQHVEWRIARRLFLHASATALLLGAAGATSACSTSQDVSGPPDTSNGEASGSSSGSASASGSSGSGSSGADATVIRDDASTGAAGNATGSPEDVVSEAGQNALADTSMIIMSKAPFDWVGIVGTGQSLAVGGGGTDQQQPISTQPSAHDLKLVDNGPDPKYPIDPSTGAPKWAAVGLDEPIRNNVSGQGPGYSDGQYPNNIQGETPHSAMASTLGALFAARGGIDDYVSVHSVVGWFGRCLVDIDKEGGQRAYPASLNEARTWTELAQKAGKTFGYGGIILTHGECDATNTGYAAGLYQFWSDYNADLKAITGQTRDVVLFGSQQSTINSGATGSAVQLWQASVAHPDQIMCTGPKYQYQYGPDLLHLPAPGYVRLGEKYAEVFDIVVNQGRPWRPVQPTKVTRSGATITVDLDVPNPPLLWDAVLAPPHQKSHQEWALGKGFEVTGPSGNALTISGVAIMGESVVITLSADPGAGKVQVAYAITQDGGGTQGGTVLGLRGLLRDSDDFEGSDAEDIDTVVTQGSAGIKSAAAGAFLRRTSGDMLTGTNAPPTTVVATRNSNDDLTLATPWPNASGTVKLHYHHSQANYCVHFAMAEGQ
jgi:hypothetical protein